MDGTTRQQAAVLAAITLAVFSSSLTADFVYDARMQILTGDFIHDWRNWPAVLSFRVLGMDVLDFNRPVMLASLMLDAAFWGREPFGYHLTSVLLHVANVLLLWRVIRQLIQPDAGPVPAAPSRPETVLLPLLAALVFAVHPIVAEAVCEPTFREDLLVVFFSLSALVLAMGHDPATHGWDRWRTFGCIASCLLAIASKEAGIVAPMLLAAYWWLFRRGEPGRFWAMSIGGAKLLVIAFVAARFLLEPTPSKIFEARPEYPGGSLVQAMLIEPRILALYAQLILFPVNLCADYGLVSISHLPLPLALLLLAAIAVAATIAARHDRRLLFAYALILLPLVPVANLIPIYRPAADRYLYMPMAGVALTVACLLDAPWLAGREDLRRRALVGGLVAVALLGLVCIERQRVWVSSLTLWEDSFRKNPTSFTNAAGLGEALREADRLPEAEQFTREAIRLSDGQRGDVWVTLALILDAQRRPAEAAEAVTKAIAIDPRLADPDTRVAALAMERPMAEAWKRLLATAGHGDWSPAEK
jgi:tetratricopeptide (TPR) repeat protein